jgi:hypothetical protein
VIYLSFFTSSGLLSSGLGAKLGQLSESNTVKSTLIWICTSVRIDSCTIFYIMAW